MSTDDRVFNYIAGAGIGAVAAVAAGLGAGAGAGIGGGGVADAGIAGAGIAAVVAGAAGSVEYKPFSFFAGTFSSAASIIAIAASLANDPAPAAEVLRPGSHTLTLQGERCPEHVRFEGRSVTLPVGCALE